MNWSFLIITFVIAASLLLIAHHFLGKNGLIAFVVAGGILGNILPDTLMFETPVTSGTTIFACMFFAVLVMYFNYGKKDAFNLVIIGTTVIATLFVLNFFKALYLNNEFTNYLSWETLGGSVMSIFSFSIGSSLTILIAEKLENKVKNQYLKYFILTLIAIVLDTLIFSGFAYIGILSFGEIMAIVGLSILVKVVVSLATAGLSYIMKNKE